MKNEPENKPAGSAEASLVELLCRAQWPDDDSDPLDRLLRAAQWPEMVEKSSPDVRRIGLRRKRKRILAVAGAAAAAVFIAAVAIWAARNFGQESAGGSWIVETPPVIAVTGENPRKVPRPLPSQEERLRLILEQVRARTAADDAEIDRIIARRVAEPEGDLAELVQPLTARRAELEQRLLARVKVLLGEREAAAVDLLGSLGSEASLPLLRRERLKPSTHVVAVRALVKLADSRTLARLERQEWDDDLREEISEALRSRRDTQTTVSTLFTEGDQSCPERQSDFWPHADLF
jgi:hypothetical protein